MATRKTKKKATAKGRRRDRFDAAKAREKLRRLVRFGRAEKHPREYVQEHAEHLMGRFLQDGDHNAVIILGELMWGAFADGVDAAARATALLSEDELPPKARAS